MKCAMLKPLTMMRCIRPKLIIVIIVDAGASANICDDARSSRDSRIENLNVLKISVRVFGGEKGNS